jgi:hypothetical protein
MLLEINSCELAYNNDAVTILTELEKCRFLNMSASSATTSLKPL